MKNIGSTDKIIRLAFAAVLLSLIFLLPEPTRWLGLLGLVPLVTALTGTCPLYTVLGMNTCGVDSKTKPQP